MPRPDAPFVAWLGAVAGDAALVGGKAASLEALARLGFRIPPGFCLTTRAFDRQLAGLPGVAEVLGRLPDEAARSELTAAFEDGPVEADIAAALSAAVMRLTGELEDLGAIPVRLAVRSSGIGEDSSAASFAGLHETELGVTPEGVAGAVLRCWASLWSPAAMAYRLRKGLALDGGGMAVVVQALVPADAAAVVFTRHPVTGRSDQLVITAIRGLGEAMVSGTVTPDTWVVDKGTRAAIEFTPGDRAAGQAGAALSLAQLTDLASLALAVEDGFGAPVDVEAAVAREAWYLLQARPITTH
ncbi:MAG: PEP/pyruvate-binding domain-containing protein [Chloroflexi bacterium]|nr:PEP/pyruvate-binding domain-containing protein [Chloroflexota bacterium]